MDIQKRNLSLNESKDALIILDQTVLPNQTRFLELSTQLQIFDAIKRLNVRGAPAIGIAAAYGFYLSARELAALDLVNEDFFDKLKETKAFLASARPTAVNLMWALERMQNTAYSHKELAQSDIVGQLLSEAEQIKAEDEAACRAIGEYGLTLLKPGMSILTHCNAGWLAASKYGTALAPIYLGHEKGYNFKVYSDETRPLLQGARLTIFELNNSGIDVTLLCDNMAAGLMAQGKIDVVIVGADRIAKNGDTANKTGTLGLSILAKYYRIPFYVCTPISTIDFYCDSGSHIPIEQRDACEVTTLWYKTPMAPEEVKVYNPAFDVTDHANISAIITEKGIIRAPFEYGIRSLFNRADLEV